MNVINLEYIAGAPHVVACPRCAFFAVYTGFDRVNERDTLVAQELGVFVVKRTCGNCAAVTKVRIRCSTVVETIVVVSP